MQWMKQLMSLVFAVSLFTACVPAKKLEDAQSQINKLQSENKDLQAKLADANSQVTTLSETINDLNGEIKKNDE